MNLNNKIIASLVGLSILAGSSFFLGKSCAPSASKREEQRVPLPVNVAYSTNLSGSLIASTDYLKLSPSEINNYHMPANLKNSTVLSLPISSSEIISPNYQAEITVYDSKLDYKQTAMLEVILNQAIEAGIEIGKKDLTPEQQKRIIFFYNNCNRLALGIANEKNENPEENTAKANNKDYSPLFEKNRF